MKPTMTTIDETGNVRCTEYASADQAYSDFRKLWKDATSPYKELRLQMPGKIALHTVSHCVRGREPGVVAGPWKQWLPRPMLLPAYVTTSTSPQPEVGYAFCLPEPFHSVDAAYARFYELRKEFEKPDSALKLLALELPQLGEMRVEGTCRISVLKDLAESVADYRRVGPPF